MWYALPMRRTWMLRCLGLAGLVLAALLIPAPPGIATAGWHLLWLFVAAVTAMTFGLPPGPTLLLAAMLGLALGIYPGAGSGEQLSFALSGFSAPVIWLILGAFFLSQALRNSGLGERIALTLIAVAARSLWGLCYALGAADLLLSPFIPSNTARGAGTMLPIVSSVLDVLGVSGEGAEATPSKARLGAYLSFSVFQMNVITSAFFLTAMAANPLAAEIAARHGADLSFLRWLLYSIVPCSLALALLPLWLGWRFKPEVDDLAKVRKWARAEVRKKGPLSRTEWTNLGVFALAVVFWAAGPSLGLESTWVALSAVALLLLGGVLKWEHVTGHRIAWDTFFWFSLMLAFADALAEWGITAWLGRSLVGTLEGVPLALAGTLVVATYALVHYGVASQTAHVLALFGVFLGAATDIGLPATAIAMQLAWASNYFGCTTTYGTSVAPPYFALGFLSQGRWMGEGALLLLIHWALFIGVGGLWLKLWL